MLLVADGDTSPAEALGGRTASQDIVRARPRTERFS